MKEKAYVCIGGILGDYSVCSGGTSASVRSITTGDLDERGIKVLLLTLRLLH